jgi:hypothetical protein
MIDADYLSFLRSKYNCQDLLLMVQLEQITPGWWPNQPELAKQLGMEPHTASQALLRLRKRGLVEAITYGKGGTFIWWVKRSAGEKPKPSEMPSWTVKNILTGKTEKVTILDRQGWAERNGLHYDSFRLFLNGYRKIMDKRFQVVSTPIDECVTSG